MNHVFKCSNLRNRVVHTGHVPSESEAIDALEAAHDAERFVKDLLVGKCLEYPRTALLVLGIDGLKKRNAWTKKLEQLAEGGLLDEPLYLDSYRNWLNDIGG